MCIKDHQNHSKKPSQTPRNQYHKNIVDTSPQDPLIEKEVLIKKVSIFDGTSGDLITGKDVVLLGNKIQKIIPSGGSEEGALADVLIYNKNPLKDASVAEVFENNLKLIIKDGNVHKNTL